MSAQKAFYKRALQDCGAKRSKGGPGGIFILKASLIHICFSFPTSYTHECQQESLFVDL